MKNKIKVGIMPEEKFRQRILAIAKGEYKPRSDEPKVWFSSLNTFYEYAAENHELIDQSGITQHEHDGTHTSGSK